ncbi:MAG: hypothetical protein HQL42_19185 [Alphaproteobacteria bacterium]|nr:hypothetical protein [Alphaproteobacteria bacterium]
MPDSAAPVFAPITLTPFGSPKPIRFTSLEEVEAWVDAEIAGWEPMYRYNGNFTQFQEHAASIESVRAAVKSAKVKQSEPAFAFVLERVRRLEAPPYLALDCPGSNLILTEVGRDRATAAVLLKLWLGSRASNEFRQFDLNIVALLRAATIWGVTDGGRSDAVAQQRNTVSLRLGKWDSDLKNSANRAEEAFGRFEAKATEQVARQQQIAADQEQLLASQRENLDALAAHHRDTLSRLHDHHKSELTTLHRDAKDAFDGLIRIFTEHMRLKAPADYWRDKAAGHKTSATKWLRVLMGALGAGCVGLGVAYWLYLYDWIAHLSKDGASAPAAVLLALPGLLYLTLVKVAHKSYRDEVRLAADAEQRTTLVQTYLSLTEGNDNGVLAGERLLALHALFRGTAHSDSPDDTPPVNSLEAIIQSLKPKDR